MAMRKLGHKKKINLGWIQSLLCQQEARKKNVKLFFTNSTDVKRNDHIKSD